MVFQPGKSGNPGGRPKNDEATIRVRDLAREFTEEALETLVEIMKDKTAPPASRVSASGSLLDRGWGKPVQDMNLNGELNVFTHEMTLKQLGSDDE